MRGSLVQRGIRPRDRLNSPATHVSSIEARVSPRSRDGPISREPARSKGDASPSDALRRLAARTARAAVVTGMGGAAPAPPPAAPDAAPGSATSGPLELMTLSKPTHERRCDTRSSKVICRCNVPRLFADAARSASICSPMASAETIATLALPGSSVAGLAVPWPLRAAICPNFSIARLRSCGRDRRQGVGRVPRGRAFGEHFQRAPGTEGRDGHPVCPRLLSASPPTPPPPTHPPTHPTYPPAAAAPPSAFRPTAAAEYAVGAACGCPAAVAALV